MREEYEQLELDTRRQLDKAIAQLTEDTVKTAGEMITACGGGAHRRPKPP